MSRSMDKTTGFPSLNGRKKKENFVGFLLCLVCVTNEMINRKKKKKKTIVKNQKDKVGTCLRESKRGRRRRRRGNGNTPLTSLTSSFQAATFQSNHSTKCCDFKRPWNLKQTRRRRPCAWRRTRSFVRSAAAAERRVPSGLRKKV